VRHIAGFHQMPVFRDAVGETTHQVQVVRDSTAMPILALQVALTDRSLPRRLTSSAVVGSSTRAYRHALARTVAIIAALAAAELVPR
jgi:hypothetical protein